MPLAVISQNRLVLLQHIIDEEGADLNNPHLYEIDRIIASHVNPHMIDFLEKYSVWPLSEEDKTNVYIGYYARVSRYFIRWLIKEGKP
jgi:hypothetical protein